MQAEYYVIVGKDTDRVYGPFNESELPKEIDGIIMDGEITVGEGLIVLAPVAKVKFGSIKIEPLALSNLEPITRFTQQ